MTTRITVNPNIHFGKPCIAGTRIPVQNVLQLIRDNISLEEIVTDYYPDIQLEDVQACIQYVIDVLAVQDQAPTAASA